MKTGESNDTLLQRALTRYKIQKNMISLGVLPVFAHKQPQSLELVAEVLNEVQPFIEISCLKEGVLDDIEMLRTKYPNLIVGIGSMVDNELVRRNLNRREGTNIPTVNDAYLAGAQVMFSANSFNSGTYLEFPDVAFVSRQAEPGAMVRDLGHGASFIKYFPAHLTHADSSLANPTSHKYLQSIQVPNHYLPIIPSGGISKYNISDYIGVGCSAVNMSTGAIIGKDEIKHLQGEEFQKKLEHNLDVLYNAKQSARTQFNLRTGITEDDFVFKLT